MIPEFNEPCLEVQTPVQADSLIAAGILRTLIYADIFDFAMTAEEIHHFLIGVHAAADEVRRALGTSPWLRARIEHPGSFYTLRGRAALVECRLAREAAAAALWPKARRYGSLLAHLPFVRMVAMTGALSMHNPQNPHDDIDFLIVTRPGRVWLARALAVLLVRFARLEGVQLCPNYVLSETALIQEPQDLYMAHELVQMVPLANLALYRKMRTANDWSCQWIPNAEAPYYQEHDRRPTGIGRFVQRSAEVLLAGWLGNQIETWERKRKLRKFASRSQQALRAAQMDSQRVKGHFDDHGAWIMARYAARLHDCALDDLALLAAPTLAHISDNSDLVNKETHAS